jgi:hypothetical protein
MNVLLAAQDNVTWHLIPLSAVISLVYSASRYELRDRILRRSLSLFAQIMVFMILVFLILLVFSWNT